MLIACAPVLIITKIFISFKEKLHYFKNFVGLLKKFFIFVAY